MTITPRAAVALVWHQARDQVLLIRRPERSTDPWSGQWALPGGKREPHDRDLTATAIRETAEECTVRLDPAQAQPLAIAMAGRAVGAPLAVAPVLFAIPDTVAPAVTPQPSEVADWHWLSCDRLRDAHQHQRGPVRPGFMDEQWPHLLVENYPLWGFTYQVLTNWVQHTRDPS